MSESLRTRLARWSFNMMPAYWGTGARIIYVARDWREVRVRLPLTWRTRNYVGTIFGGSMYGAVDPILMVMLIHLLGPEYVVWDKSAAIRFRRPGRVSLYAAFSLGAQETDAIKTALLQQPNIDRTYLVQLTDANGVVHAEISKTIHVRRDAKDA